jgi:tetratricopeptide (TPR) repeat protein
MKLRVTVILFAFCVFYFQLTFSQGALKSNNLDSLLRTIENQNKKVDAIIQFLEEPENQYREDVKEIANRALEISQQSSYLLGKVNAMIKLGNYYFRISDFKMAMEFAQKSKEISEDLNSDKELAASLSLLGTIYNELGDHDNSAQYFFKSLKLYEKLEDKEGISHSLGNIGMDFFNQQDHKKALEYFNSSLSIAKQIGKQSAIKRQYNNIAVVYGDLQQYDTAISFLRKALEINIKLGDKLGQGTNIMNIGYDQMNQGNYDDALMSFRQSLDLFTELNNRLHMAECYLNFGFCHYTANRIDESIGYFKNALLEGQQQRYYRIIYSAAEILNHIYTEKKDTINAYRYVMLEKFAGDSLFASQKQKLLSKLELQYIYEKKEFQRKLDQQRKNNLMMVIIFSLVSGLIILGLLLSRFKLKSKFVILEKEKVESELNIKNRELTVNLISLIKKNEMLSGISNKLVELKRSAKSIEAKEIAGLISNELRSNTDDKMLNEFSTRFQEVHAGFYETLLQRFPDLTQNELKLCAFLRLNMSSKDISELTGQYPPSIDQARYRLRKKLGISNSETNLVTFLSQI